ncbi:MAG: hypothetical protein ACK4RZ_18310, partial [Paracoccaceae bacterium]
RPSASGRPGMATWMSARVASVAGLVRATRAAGLKRLEDEDARLKRLLAEATLDNAAPKEALARRMMISRLSERRSICIAAWRWTCCLAGCAPS